MRDHPGGASIIRMFGGKDATAAFLDVHSEVRFIQYRHLSFSNTIIIVTTSTTRVKQARINLHHQHH
jgi:cytochrome b involved in lipid metabolism